MAYTEIQNVNITGMDDILVYVITQVPILSGVLLACIWLIFSLTIYFGTRKFNGSADFFAGAAVGGFMTAIIGTILTFASGAINLTMLSTVLIIAAISLLLLIPRRSRD